MKTFGNFIMGMIIGLFIIFILTSVGILLTFNIINDSFIDYGLENGYLQHNPRTGKIEIVEKHTPRSTEFFKISQRLRLKLVEEEN